MQKMHKVMKVLFQQHEAREIKRVAELTDNRPPIFYARLGQIAEFHYDVLLDFAVRTNCSPDFHAQSTIP